MKAHLQLSSSKHFVIDISKLFWIAADTGKLARTGQFWRNCHIGPEKDLPNFLLIHLTNPYSVNMVKPQQTRQHSPWRWKIRISYFFHEHINTNLTVLSTGICNELVKVAPHHWWHTSQRITSLLLAKIVGCYIPYLINLCGCIGYI